MIHYHGSPLSGPSHEVSRFFRGRHAMISFAHPRDLPICAEVCQSFALDNGAFSVWKSGGTLDFSTYTRWVERWIRHPGFDWALIPDVIDGDELSNDNYIDNWVKLGLKNYGVPVWHLHESFERLDYLVCEWNRVALGSSGDFRNPGSKTWWTRMREVMNIVCDENGCPHTRLHGLRMMDPRIFEKLPLASADSVNASMNAGSLKRFGMYLPPTPAQRAVVIADRIEISNSNPVWVCDE